MESNSYEKRSEGVINCEEYKEMWMSLFDVSVISSCSGKDLDLFCASALLKTAFFAFIKLKRRLIVTEELIESQRLALEAYEREKTAMKSKLPCSTTAVCFRCGGEIEGYKWQPGRMSINSNLDIRNADDIGTKASSNDCRSSEDEISCSQREKSSKQDLHNVSKIIFSTLEDPVIGAVNLKDEDSHNMNKRHASPISESKFSPCNLEKDIETHQEMQNVSCITPKKRSSQTVSQDVSPILKQFKKPRLSPTVIVGASESGKKHLKSTSLYPSEMMSSLTVDLTKNVCCRGLFSGGKKISPVSLRLKKTETNSSTQLSDADGGQDTKKLSENEEVEIILPTPVSPKNVGYSTSKGIPSPDEDDPRTKKGKVEKRMTQMPFDTEMTLFLPMEEHETGKSDDEHVIEEEVLVDDGVGHMAYLDSFDQVPVKSDSPSYRYQRVAVRKRKERRKLLGWECKDCQKYYEAASLSSAERRDLLNKCSRHRDKFAPVDSLPKGFWNPLFPETPW